MDTTNKATFTSFEGAMPAERIKQRTTVPFSKRDKFQNESQSSIDYAGYLNGQPQPPRPSTPPPVTIDLKFDNR